MRIFWRVLKPYTCLNSLENMIQNMNQVLNIFFTFFFFLISFSLPNFFPFYFYSYFPWIKWSQVIEDHRQTWGTHWAIQGCRNFLFYWALQLKLHIHASLKHSLHVVHPLLQPSQVNPQVINDLPFLLQTIKLNHIKLKPQKWIFLENVSESFKATVRRILLRS